MGASASARSIDVLAQLKQLLGRRASDAEAVREHHSHGESYHPAAAPDIVCFPESTEEVQAIMAISARHRMPVIRQKTAAR